MSQTKYLKGECSHCGGRLEFPADAIGTMVECPHCSKPTELTLAAPPEQSSVPGKAVFWTVIAVLILGLGLAAAMSALHRAQRLAASRQREHAAVTPAVTNSTPLIGNAAMGQNEFQVSAIQFEKTPGTSLIHAVGTAINLAPKQRFAVKLELDLLDSSGKKIGIARDYQQVIEPGGQWKFNAPVIDTKAVSAVLASIKDDQ